MVNANNDNGVAPSSRSNGTGLGKSSKIRLAECHPDLQRVIALAAGRFPLTVICGHRNQADQDAAYKSGNSKVKWPQSRHNSKPSTAVDLAPWPINWNDITRFREMALVVLRAASELGIKLEWGGNWEKFPDAPHFQLVLTK